MQSNNPLLNKALLLGEVIVGFYLLLAALMTPNLFLKGVGLSGAAIACVLSVPLGRKIETGVEAEFEREMIAQDARLFDSGLTLTKPEPEEVVSDADLTGAEKLKAIIAKRNLYPVVFILSPQGGGKTRLAHYLAATSRAMGNTSIAITHNYDRGDWTAANRFIRPRNLERLWFNRNEKEAIRLNDLDDGASYLQAIMAILAEYQYRMKNSLTMQNTPKLQLFDIFLDESNGLFQALCQKQDLNSYLYETGLIEDFVNDKVEIDNRSVTAELNRLSSYWRRLAVKSLTEFRKFGIRVFFIGQASTVSQLGMKGMAALKDQSTIIKVGSACMGYLDYGQRNQQRSNPHAWMTVNEIPFRKPDADELNYPVYLITQKHGETLPGGGKAASKAISSELKDGFTLTVPVSSDPVRLALEDCLRRGLTRAQTLEDREIKDLAKRLEGIPKRNARKNREARAKWLSEGWADLYTA